MAFCNPQEKFAGEAKAGVEAYLTGLTVLDADITAHIPQQARPRAGAVVGRMLQAGYTAKQANLAISALYVSRNQRALVKLWGMLDRERWGAINTALFDKTMLLFSEVLEEDQLPELRSQLGFVNPAEVTLREFEAALRLLVPTDGSPADLRKIDSNVSVVDLLGGAANVERMQSFQLQRVARLAQRMHNFGYDPAALQLVCRTLFLTRLHNKDLWQLWRFFSKGQTEVPLTLGQTRHLLSLLSEVTRTLTPTLTLTLQPPSSRAAYPSSSCPASTPSSKTCLTSRAMRCASSGMSYLASLTSCVPSRHARCAASTSA